MKEVPQLIILIILVLSCQGRPSPWDGPVLNQPRDYLTVDELLAGKKQLFIDMSHFSAPKWAKKAKE